MLLRFAKRLANWEAPVAADALEAEFRGKDGKPDMRPSVYQASPNVGSEVRLGAEHSVAIEPPRTALAVDIAAVARLTDCTPGNPKFAFARDSHREVPLLSIDDFNAFILALTTLPPSTRHPVERAAIYEYVSAKLADGDIEWTRAAAEPGAKKWLAKLATKKSEG